MRPDTHAGCSDIKINQETTRMSESKHDITKANIKMTECTNDIPISRRKLLIYCEAKIQYTPPHHAQYSGTTQRPG